MNMTQQAAREYRELPPGDKVYGHYDTVVGIRSSSSGAAERPVRQDNAAGGIQRFGSFKQLKTGLGSAGEDNVWHHIVEQTEANVERFGAEAIHSTENVVSVPTEHQSGHR